MKVAVVGSRGLQVNNLEDYLPAETELIITGGARGVDSSARLYAQEHGIELLEILPDYRRYRRAAPLKRNIAIIDRADMVLVFWDGHSTGTAYVINACRERNVPCQIHIKKSGSP